MRRSILFLILLLTSLSTIAATPSSKDICLGAGGRLDLHGCVCGSRYFNPYNEICKGGVVLSAPKKNEAPSPRDAVAKQQVSAAPSGPVALVSIRSMLKLGELVYVLEQPGLRSQEAYLRIWKIDVVEYVRSMGRFGVSKVFESSKKWSSVALDVASSELFLLADDGRLFRKNLADSGGVPRALQGRYVLLERGAEANLVAISAEQEVVYVGSTESTLTPRSAVGDLRRSTLGLGKEERVIALARESDESIWLLTSTKTLILWDMRSNAVVRKTSLPDEFGPSVEKILVADESIWGFDGHARKLLRYNLKSGRQSGMKQVVDLGETFDSGQDGHVFEFIPTRPKDASKEGIYARKGVHLFKFFPSPSGALSSAVAEQDIFGLRMRVYGISYGLHNSISVLVPRPSRPNSGIDCGELLSKK